MSITTYLCEKFDKSDSDGVTIGDITNKYGKHIIGAPVTLLMLYADWLFLNNPSIIEPSSSHLYDSLFPVCVLVSVCFSVFAVLIMLVFMCWLLLIFFGYNWLIIKQIKVIKCKIKGDETK